MSVSGSESGHSCAESAEGAVAGPVGRRVWGGQAADRRVIALVQARPLLYARSALPVASLYCKVKRLWQEVADEMNWTVAEVRRKWSHIRNSYSRHLRHEALGSCTGRGRRVSRWYLADELEFLREHMATDTRVPLSFLQINSLTNFKSEPKPEPESSLIEEQPVSPAWTGEGQGGAWGSGAEEHLASPVLSPARSPAQSPVRSPARSPARSPPGSPDSRSFFPFFSGLREEYRQLTSGRRRRFRRACLAALHALLDEQEQDGTVMDNVQIILHEPHLPDGTLNI